MFFADKLINAEMLLNLFNLLSINAFKFYPFSYWIPAQFTWHKSDSFKLVHIIDCIIYFIVPFARNERAFAGIMQIIKNIPFSNALSRLKSHYFSHDSISSFIGKRHFNCFLVLETVPSCLNKNCNRISIHLEEN